MKKQSNNQKKKQHAKDETIGTKRLIIFSIISLTIIFLDQLTKHYARVYLKEPVFLLSDKIYLYLVYNTGAAFGVLKGFRLVFLVLTAVLLIIFLYHFKKIMKTSYWVGASLVFAGAVGNLIDRALFGMTTDFFNIWTWPAFNIADSAITIGATILIIKLLKEK